MKYEEYINALKKLYTMEMPHQYINAQNKYLELYNNAKSSVDGVYNTDDLTETDKIFIGQISDLMYSIYFNNALFYIQVQHDEDFFDIHVFNLRKVIHSVLCIARYMHDRENNDSEYIQLHDIEESTKCEYLGYSGNGIMEHIAIIDRMQLEYHCTRDLVSLFEDGICRDMARTYLTYSVR
jgi:hypothetical protein